MEDEIQIVFGRDAITGLIFVRFDDLIYETEKYVEKYKDDPALTPLTVVDLMWFIHEEMKNQ